MTREQYIQLRITSRYKQIVYAYFLEKGITKLSFDDFIFLFEKWLIIEQNKTVTAEKLVTKEEILDYIIDGVISYYDGKFTIIYLEVKTNHTLIF